jgi:cell division protein FtsB
MMRTSSAITIVRGFLQQTKLDDKLAKVMANTSANPSEMKTLLDAKKSLNATITDLAEQSCLSLKHNKNASKGENTWTGKIKKLKDIDLRDAEVNGFDIGTCRGMQQVLEISDASIMKQLELDESEWSDMVAKMREVIVSLRKQLAQYKEINRILLQENLDLKDYLEESKINILPNTVNLKELYAPFSSLEEKESEEVLDNADSG